MLKTKLSYIPTAEPKMLYVIETIKRIGKHITVVSCANSTHGYFRGEKIDVDRWQQEIYFRTFKS